MRRPFLAVLVVAALPLLVRALWLPVLPAPLPRIHDEFSYLLAGDTFAHGRVTNPAHPLWPFFESFHVLAQPSYMSKYSPAQGLFLAAGEVLFGHPWWGVFLSVGVMCGAVCWMLEAWVPRRWAVLGGLAVALQFGITDYWMNSYWGGAPGAAGRLFGFRGRRVRPVRDGVLLALGAAILLNSRPWEGLTIMLPVGIGFLYWLATSARHRAVPAASLLARDPGDGQRNVLLCLADHGPSLELPYVAVHKAYSVAPLFVWQKQTPEPTYHHAVMRRFYTQWETHYQSVDTLHNWRGWTR